MKALLYTPAVDSYYIYISSKRTLITVVGRDDSVVISFKFDTDNDYKDSLLVSKEIELEASFMDDIDAFGFMREREIKEKELAELKRRCKEDIVSKLRAALTASS